MKSDHKLVEKASKDGSLKNMPSWGLVSISVMQILRASICKNKILIAVKMTFFLSLIVLAKVLQETSYLILEMILLI